MDNKNDIIKKIRNGEIDINNQSLFFPIIIKGLLVKLNEQLTIRGKKIPHFIIHTGDDTMYLSVKGQNAAIEPLEVSNEDYVYNSVPRCIVTVNGMTLETDQLTNPYTLGQMQYESDDSVYTLAGEFRRVPVKLAIGCKYYVDSFGDMMGLAQQIISKLAFIQTYVVSYLGQAIICSYTIPTSIDGEYTAELDGMSQDNKLRTTELSLEIETNFPVWEVKTMMPTDKVIVYTSGVGLDGAWTQDDLVKKDSNGHVEGTDQIYDEGIYYGPNPDPEHMTEEEWEAEKQAHIKEIVSYSDYKNPEIENPSSKLIIKE